MLKTVMRISYPLELQNNRCDRPIITGLNEMCFELGQVYLNHNSIRKQKAMKLASMMPSLLFFEPMRPIRLLIPGT
jgi:hypothetical protein